MNLTCSRRPAVQRQLSCLLVLVLGALCSLATPGRAHALPAYFNGSESEFYKLPTPAQTPAGGPGTVVRWQRFDPSVILSGFADPIVAYRMLYKSTSHDGSPTIVSGTVLMPVRLSFNAGDRPIVGFATGTQGMADRCAAVHGIANSTNFDLAYMRPALDKGWALAVADYQGLGLTTPNDEHPEIVGRILGRNVLDSVRTVAQFAGDFDGYVRAHWPEKIAIWANVRATSKVVLWGYSEGGNASAWAAELQPSYARELRLVGVASGGVPADPAVVASFINTPGKLQNVAFGVLMAAVVGFKAAYPTLPLDGYLKPEGVSLLETIKKQCLFETLASNWNGRTFSQYVKPEFASFNPLTNAAWLARLNENKLGSSPPTVPAFLWHAKDDESLEFCQARKLAKTYCERGVYLTWKKYAGEHALGWGQGLSPSLDFLDRRINGGSLPSSCVELQGPDSSCPGQ